MEKVKVKKMAFKGIRKPDTSFYDHFKNNGKL